MKEREKETSAEEGSLLERDERNKYSKMEDNLVQLSVILVSRIKRKLEKRRKKETE